MVDPISEEDELKRENRLNQYKKYQENLDALDATDSTTTAGKLGGKKIEKKSDTQNVATQVFKKAVNR